MTGQIPDKFHYEGDEYDLVGLNGESLYEPMDFGITTKAASTACWRGYMMFYDCRNGQMILDQMHTRTDDKIVVNGITPRIADESSTFSFFNTIYEDLDLKVKFTGSILLATDFISEMYVHMGFQKPESYRKVLEIHLVDGDITEVRDLSDEMESRRKSEHHAPRRPDSLDESDVQDWIKDRFSLGYESG